MNTPAKIETIIKSSGLELEVANEIKSSYLPFLENIQKVIDQAAGISKENPTEEDCKLARELRLSLVPNRTNAHKFKMSRTAKLRIVKNIEDASYNLIDNESKLVEMELKEIEEFQELKEQRLRDELKARREAIAREFIENPELFPLAAMTGEQFDRFVEDQKLARQAREKIEAENKAKEEAERLAAIEEQKKKEAEAKRLAAENEKLKKEAQAKETKLKAEADKREAEAKKIEQKRRMDEQAAAQAHKEFVEGLEETLLADGWQKDEFGLSKEGHYIKNSELKEHSLATLSTFMRLTHKEILEERKQKEAELLKKSPDKDQLNKWISEMSIPEVNLTSESSVQAYANIRVKFEGFKKWALSEIDKLK